MIPTFETGTGVDLIYQPGRRAWALRFRAIDGTVLHFCDIDAVAASQVYASAVAQCARVSECQSVAGGQ